MSHALMNNYQRLAPAFVRGEGVWLYDTSDHAYLDALSGLAVCGLGHAHPVVHQAIAKQASQLIHTSNLYRIPQQEQLAQQLVEHSGMSNVCFVNSGTEANEAAIKLARLYAYQNNIEQPKIIVMQGGFHGRTMGALSATMNKRIHQGFHPLLEGFIEVPYNDVNTLQQLVEPYIDQVVAIMLEPVQGEGGVVIPNADYLSALRELCDQHNWLLILDEVQTGMCRTGQWFACQHGAVCPDIMTLAKALGNGVPIGACLATKKATDLFQPGSHGSTFGGNPLASSAALAVIDYMQTHNLAERSQYLGSFMLKLLQESLHGIEGVVEVRGLGLMIGIELDRPCADMVQLALNERLLINVTAGQTIRLLPPLITSDEEAEQIVTILVPLIKRYLSEK